MKTLWILVKTGILNQWKICELKSSKDKKMRSHIILMAGVFVLLGGMAVTYAAAGAIGLLFIGMGNLIPSAALTFTVLFTLFFTVYKTNGILFGIRDYDMLAALPIKHSILVASRFMQLYLMNLLAAVLIMLPMGIVYGIGTSRGLFYYVMWFCSIFAAPLIPTTLAAIAGVLIMAVSVRMKHPNVVSGVLSILLVTGILAGSMGFGSMGEEMDVTQLTNGLALAEKELMRVYPVNLLFSKAIRDNNLLYFALFLAGSYLWYRLFVTVTALKYKSIQSAFLAHRKTEGKKGKAFHTEKTPMQALVSKEWKRFLNSNNYLLNMGMGVIMLILATLALILAPEKNITKVLEESGIHLNFSAVGGLLAPFLAAALGSMSCTTSCALSLEGKNMEMLRTLPLRPIEIYESKIRMNLMLLIPTGLFCSLVLGIRFSVGPADGIFSVLLPVVFYCFSAVWGMFLNIKMPNFSWENEVMVIKQSMPSFCGIFSGMLLVMVCGVLVFLMPAELRTIGRIVVAAAVAAVTIMLYRKLGKMPLPQ